MWLRVECVTSLAIEEITTLTRPPSGFDSSDLNVFEPITTALCPVEVRSRKKFMSWLHFQGILLSSPMPR